MDGEEHHQPAHSRDRAASADDAPRCKERHFFNGRFPSDRCEAAAGVPQSPLALERNFKNVKPSLVVSIFRYTSFPVVGWCLSLFFSGSSLFSVVFGEIDTAFPCNLPVGITIRHEKGNMSSVTPSMHAFSRPRHVCSISWLIKEVQKRNQSRVVYDDLRGQITSTRQLCRTTTRWLRNFAAQYTVLFTP